MCGDSVPERFSLFASILTKLLSKRYPDDRLCHTIANAEVDNSRHLSSPAPTRTRSNLSPSAVSARHRRHRWLNKQRRDLDSGVYSVSVFMPDRSRGYNCTPLKPDRSGHASPVSYNSVYCLFVCLPLALTHNIRQCRLLNGKSQKAKASHDQRQSP